MRFPLLRRTGAPVLRLLTGALLVAALAGCGDDGVGASGPGTAVGEERALEVARTMLDERQEPVPALPAVSETKDQVAPP